MTRNAPEDGHRNPALIQAFNDAIEGSVSPNVAVEEQQAQHGKRWLLSYRRTITPAQNALYIYIDNPTSSMLSVEGVSVYTDGSLLIDSYDEPTLDESTFSSDDFRNFRSSVTKDPPWNAYSGTENNVTVSDLGREFLVDIVETGQRRNIGHEDSAPGYIIDSSSSALIVLENNISSDIQVSATISFHEQVDVPELTQLSGTN